MDAGIAKRGVVLTRRDAHCPECGGVGCLDVPLKKNTSHGKFGELKIMRSFLSDFSVSSCSLFGIRSFHRTRHAFCMAHHQVIVMGEHR